VGRWIIHVDMDAFFAAIEQRDNPALRGKPVIVGGDPQGRGVVSAASYEARRFGIHSAMPTIEAQRRCSQAIILPVRGERYQQVSRQVMALLGRFSPVVEQVSIDEAFVEVTGCQRLLGSPEEIVREIQRRLRQRLELSASLGVAPNKFLAKLASERDKPGGLVVVRPEDIEDFLRDLLVTALWGVGESTAERLSPLGLHTVGQLANYPLDLLIQQFGEYGRRLHDLAHGRDYTPVTSGGERKSVSAEITFGRDTADRELLESTLLRLSERVGSRLRQSRLAGTTVTLKLRFPDFRTITRQQTSTKPVAEDLAIYRRAHRLLEPHLASGRKIRLIGVGVSNFPASQQPSLFESPPRESAVDQAIDRVREKFGPQALQRGRLVSQPEPGEEAEDNRE